MTRVIPSINDLPAGLSNAQRYRWLNANLATLIDTGVPWLADVSALAPKYFQTPLGFGYRLHERYLNGPSDAFDKAVDMRRDIAPFAIPDDIALREPSGTQAIPKAVFPRRLATVIKQDPTFAEQINIPRGNRAWRTAMGHDGLMISEDPVEKAMRDWLRQCIALYLERFVDLEGHIPGAAGAPRCLGSKHVGPGRARPGVRAPVYPRVRFRVRCLLCRTAKRGFPGIDRRTTGMVEICRKSREPATAQSPPDNLEARGGDAVPVPGLYPAPDPGIQRRRGGAHLYLLRRLVIPELGSRDDRAPCPLPGRR